MQDNEVPEDVLKGMVDLAKYVYSELFSGLSVEDGKIIIHKGKIKDSPYLMGMLEHINYKYKQSQKYRISCDVTDKEERVSEYNLEIFKDGKWMLVTKLNTHKIARIIGEAIKVVEPEKV